MLDLGRETASLRIFIKLRSEISSKWSLTPKVALHMHRSRALSCTSNFIPTLKLQCFHSVQSSFSTCISSLCLYVKHLPLMVVKTNAHHRNTDKNNNGIKRNGISILSWRKNKIFQKKRNKCCEWIWKKITVILKIVLTCYVLHIGSTAITALFRTPFSFFFIHVTHYLCYLYNLYCQLLYFIYIKILTNKMAKGGRGT